MAGRSAVSRRALLGAGGAGVLAGAAGLFQLTRTSDEPEAASGVIPFYGPHQAGITTPVQDRLHFAAFDLTVDDPERVVALLREWTAAAAAMTRGLPVGGGAVGGEPLAPPDDTGEALGLPASRLTLTLGFGPSFFTRLGLADRRPPALVDLPHFPGDRLDPARSGGDLCIQACADDPQVAVHAVRNLARIGFGTVSVRWSQLGFGKTSSTTPDSQTPRNMMGFKDGTSNIPGTDEALLAEHVWAAAEDGAPWMAGGSYLVARRIRMHIETWDRASLAEQEKVIGRSKGEGASPGRSREHDPVILERMAPDAHVRLAHPDNNGGARLLRRGYSFTDGTDGLGRLDAGLFFLAYQRDINAAFVRIQTNLRGDSLNEYIQHVGSGVYAVPPGVREGGFWGDTLFS
jgi:deferrochelatase/peroxidase EfeB